jgi:hypothetical protein
MAGLLPNNSLSKHMESYPQGRKCRVEASQHRLLFEDEKKFLESDNGGGTQNIVSATSELFERTIRRRDPNLVVALRRTGLLDCLRVLAPLSI